MNSPPHAGSLELLAGYGYDDDDEEDNDEEEEAGVGGAENVAAKSRLKPEEDRLSFRAGQIGFDGNNDENASGDNAEAQPGQEAMEDDEAEDSGESDFMPPAAKRQRSASSSGGQFNFEISDDEAGGGGEEEGDDKDSASSEAPRDEASPAAQPQPQHQYQQRHHRPRLPKVDSLVSYGLGAYESDEGEEAEEGDDDGEEGVGEVVDSREASPSRAGSNSERVSNDEAGPRGQEPDLAGQEEAEAADDTAGAELKEPPPPPPPPPKQEEADGPDADSETVSAELTDEDRTQARQKANRLLLSLSSGSQAGASQLTLPPPPPPQALANRGVEQKIAGILQRQRQEPAFNPASLITKNKSYRNPSIYEKLMSFYGVDDRGTNFHPTVFDPYIWDKHSYYDSLLKVQIEAEKKRVGAATSAGKSAGEPSAQAVASRGSSSTLQPLMQLPAKKPHHHHHHNRGGEAAATDATTSGARRSKWDTAPAAGSSVGAFLRKKP